MANTQEEQKWHLDNLMMDAVKSVVINPLGTDLEYQVSLNTVVMYLKAQKKLPSAEMT